MASWHGPLTGFWGETVIRKLQGHDRFLRDSNEFIPIYGPRGLRGKEAPALAGGPCTGLQSCPPAFLAIIHVTVDALPRLVSSCEAVLQAQTACCDALHHFRMPLTR